MPGQIVNVSNNEAISEVALKCGDPFFRDFPKNIYSQAVYRAEREIATEYGILERMWSYTNTGGTSPIEIVPLNFKNEYRVTVTPNEGTEQVYLKKQVDDVLDNNLSSTANNNYYYDIRYVANVYEFYYTLPAENDIIKIYYISNIAGLEDYEPYDSEGNVNAIPVIPDRYFEETVRRAVRYMAKLGIGQFDGIKAERYSRILNIYTKRGDEKQDMGLERDRGWMQIKPFIYP